MSQTDRLHSVPKARPIVWSAKELVRHVGYPVGLCRTDQGPSVTGCGISTFTSSYGLMKGVRTLHTLAVRQPELSNLLGLWGGSEFPTTSSSSFEFELARSFLILRGSKTSSCLIRCSFAYHLHKLKKRSLDDFLLSIYVTQLFKMIPDRKDC